MDEQHKQHLIDLPKTIAGGIATPLAALLTSRFGVAGTMAGLALSAIIVTLIVDTLKVYLARVPGAVISIPGDFKKKSAWGRFLVRLRLPFSKLASLAPGRRRPILIRSLIGAVIVFIVGLVVVTGVELGVGKNLSCWAWDDCYTESSPDAGDASDASGLPSIFIATNRLSSTSAPQGGPAAPQQQPVAPPAPVAPTPPAASQSASGKGSQSPVSQQRPTAPPSEQPSSQSPGDQQQSDNQPQGAEQQQSGYDQQVEDQQQSPTSNPESDQQSPTDGSETQRPSGAAEQSPTPSVGADEAGGTW